MTTARERYEAKTRVVTFRVRQELYEELERVKVKTNLSFTDLVKLGAGIADAEVRQRLTEVADVEIKLAKLKANYQAEKQRNADIILKERSERLVKMELEFKAYKLFDLGWKLETVRYKLSLKLIEAGKYFREWAEMRKQHQALLREMLTQCLELHLKSLEQQYWHLTTVTWKPDKYQVEELKSQIDHCRSIRSDPAKLNKMEQEFLLEEYASQIWS